MAEITARNYSKRLSEKRFTLTLQTDTSMYIPKSCVQHAEQSYISLSNLNEEDEVVVHM